MDDPAPTPVPPRIHAAGRSTVVRDQGGFRTRFDFPGRAVSGHEDHGYGPLATVVESFLDPGTHIPMHAHRDEEIVSWVPDGVMRHDDRQGNDLVTDSEHLLVMNAGRGFWHAESTRADDPPLRMLQIFVRPHAIGLDPGIQHEPIPEPVPNEWRHLFGPVDGDAPLSVRNAVDCRDCRLAAGSAVALPSGRDPDRDSYLYVFDGAATVTADAPPADTPPDDDPTALERGESALVIGTDGFTVTADADTTLVAFSIDPDAPITRQGTIGR